MDDLERLINEAHDLFNDYSIFEVIIDIEDRSAAVERLKEIYGSGVDMKRLQKYLDVLNPPRRWEE